MITSFAFNAFILAVHGGNTVRQLAPNTHDVEHAMVDKGQQVMLEEEESATSHLFSDWSDDFKDMNQIIMAVVLLVFGLIFTYKGGKWFKQVRQQSIPSKSILNTSHCIDCTVTIPLRIGLRSNICSFRDG